MTKKQAFAIAVIDHIMAGCDPAALGDFLDLHDAWDEHLTDGSRAAIVEYRRSYYFVHRAPGVRELLRLATAEDARAAFQSWFLKAQAQASTSQSS